MLEIHKRCGDISEEELLKIRPTSWPSPSIALLLNSQDGEDEISIKPNHLPVSDFLIVIVAISE